MNESMNNGVDLNYTKNRPSVFYVLFCTLMIGCLVFPYSYMGVKMVLAIIAVTEGALENKFKVSTSKETAMWFILFMLFYVTWIVVGFFNQNPSLGLYSAFKAGVLYTFIFFIFSFYLQKQSEVESVLHLLEICNFFLAALATILIISSFTGIQISLIYSIMSESMTGVSYGHMGAMGGYFINEMIFTTPFIVARFFTAKRSFISYANLLLSSIAILMCGRRVIQLELIAVVLFFLIFFHKKVKWYKKLLQVIGVLIIGVLIYNVYMYTIKVGLIPSYGLAYRVTKAIELNNNNARYRQFFELWNGFKENPIIGSGIAGVLSNGYVRSSTNPWFFESSYMAILFHTGIVGTIIYLSLLLNNYSYLSKIKKMQPENDYCLPLFVGYSCILLANSVDPYLEIFDMAWMLFIIPLYYNSVISSENRQLLE